MSDHQMTYLKVQGAEQRQSRLVRNILLGCFNFARAKLKYHNINCEINLVDGSYILQLTVPMLEAIEFETLDWEWNESHRKLGGFLPAYPHSNKYEVP